MGWWGGWLSISFSMSLEHENLMNKFGKIGLIKQVIGTHSVLEYENETKCHNEMDHSFDMI